MKQKNAIDLIDNIVIDEVTNVDQIQKTDMTYLASLNQITSQLPSAVSMQILNNSYRIVMPPGTAGSLMKLKDGLLSTVLQDGNGKIIGHAGLESAAGLLSPLAIFTVLSIATGQYFLSTINKSLKNIEKGVQDIKVLLQNKQNSEIFSNMIYLKEVYHDWLLILSSAEIKNVTLSNVIISKKQLTAVFYEKLKYMESFSVSNLKYNENCIHSYLADFIEKLMQIKFILQLRAYFELVEKYLLYSFVIENCNYNIGNVELNRELTVVCRNVSGIVSDFIDELIEKAGSDRKLLILQNNKMKIEVIKNVSEQISTGRVLSETEKLFKQFVKFNNDKNELMLLNGELYLK